MLSFLFPPSIEKAAQAEETHVEVVDELDAELEALLQTPPLQGLTDAEAQARLQQFGPNGRRLQRIGALVMIQLILCPPS